MCLSVSSRSVLSSLVWIAICCSAWSANIVLYEPAIIVRTGNIDDPRAQGWANAYEALTNPQLFGSFEEWRSYFSGTAVGRLTEEMYDANVNYTGQSLTSIIYAVEHEADGSAYLFLGSVNGHAVSFRGLKCTTFSRFKSHHPER